MINLFTGTPGAGKTAYALGELLKLQDSGRPVFVHGIPNLKLTHEVIVCSAPSCSVCAGIENKEDLLKAEDWDKWAPDGAIIFIDEVQNVYRPRSSASKPSDSVMAFETHRHRGLDFYLISQSPRLFDSNIRQLVNKHIHLKSTWANRVQFEWSECKLNTASTSDAVKSSYKLDKKVFPLYKSASLHTKTERKIPTVLYVLFFVVIALCLLGYRMYDRANNYLSEPEEIMSTSPSQDSFQYSDKQLMDDDLTSLIPTDPMRPETAPIYKKLLKVKDFPRILACVYNEDKGSCKCYTQQISHYKTDLATCYSYAKGNSFNPYIEPKKKKKIVPKSV